MKLYDHQQALVDKAPDKWLLAWEVGTGKTLAALSLLKYPALVIVPKSLKEQWLENKGKHQIDVYTKEEFRKNHLELTKYNAIIFDEIHYFSGMQGIRKKSAMLKAALSYIKKHNPIQIYGLTGTPYLSTPWNIYALAEILGYKWDYNKYKNCFFSMVNMGRRFPVPIVNKKVMWHNSFVPTEEAIAMLVNYIGNTVRMDECVDVPSQVYQEEYFELTNEQKTAITKIDDVNPIVRWTKIHQICGGTLKSDGYSEDQIFKSEKMERIVQLCAEHKKLIIVCRYNYEIESIRFKIEKVNKKREVFIINGQNKDRASSITEANNSENCIILIQASCSEGYELPSFPLMVFYSYSFSLKDYIQIKGRVQRLNNIKKNVYLSLVVKGEIDEDVYKCIKNKESFDIEIYNRQKK